MKLGSLQIPVLNKYPLLFILYEPILSLNCSLFRVPVYFLYIIRVLPSGLYPDLLWDHSWGRLPRRWGGNNNGVDFVESSHRANLPFDSADPWPRWVFPRHGSFLVISCDQNAIYTFSCLTWLERLGPWVFAMWEIRLCHPGRSWSEWTAWSYRRLVPPCPMS